MKNIVLQQKHEFQYLVSLTYQKRHVREDLTPYIDSNVIKLITGPRRAGKSVFALQMLKGRNAAYLNFDDSGLLDNFDEDAVMQALAEVYPNYTHLILDEVQNLDSWDIWVGKLKRRGVNLVITGSNARMLSSEMATVLTGRYVEIKMLPFSMAECMEYRSVNIHPQLPAEKAELMLEADNYMRSGGFPEITKTRGIAKSYIGSLFDSIILKDVAQRHKIRKTQELYNLADYLISNYCNQLSYNEIAESLGMGSVTTVKKYCDFLTEPYLFFYLPRYNNKLKEMRKAPKKIYVVDNGFVLARSFELSANSGRQMENMVFVELLRRGYDLKNSLFYFRSKNDREIDFVTREGNKVTSLIQVSYEISSPKTRERELKAFVDGVNELKCNNLILITWDTKETIEYKGHMIEAIPITEWLLK
jgi:predicted AAA+ superfamily ATPase